MKLFSIFNVKSTLVSVLALSTMLGACDLEAMKRGRVDPVKDDSIPKVKTKKHKLEKKIPQDWAGLPPEITLNIFQYLGQREISPVARTCQEWNALLQDNRLWYGYAKKGHVIMEDTSYDGTENYKALVHFHSVPNLYNFGSFQARDFNYTGTIIAGSEDDKSSIAYIPKGEDVFLTDNRGGLSIEKLSFNESVNNFDHISDDGSFVSNGNLYEIQTERGFFQRVGSPDKLERLSIMDIDARGSLILGSKGSKLYVWDRHHDKVHDLNVSNSDWVPNYHKLFDAAGELITASINNESTQCFPVFWKYNREMGEIEGPFGLKNPQGEAAAFPLSVSCDGNVIVGASMEGEDISPDDYPIAMRWVKNKEGQFEPAYLDRIYYSNFKDFPGRVDQCSEARCVNYDGSVIGGLIFKESYNEDEGITGTENHKAFIWTPDRGLEILNNIIANSPHHDSIKDVNFTEVSAVTPSGHVFLAKGTFYDSLKRTKLEKSYLLVLPKGPLF